MPEYLAPGVYIEEISTRAKPIEGVGTSTTGMLGMTERGPQYPNMVTSWLEYIRWYGGYLPNRSYLPYAVKGFFDNGGQRCYIARVVPDNSTPASLVLDNLHISAIGAGAWGNSVLIRIADGSKSSTDNPTFQVAFIYYRNQADPASFPDPLKNPTDPARVEPDHIELYDNITFQDGRSNNVITIINSSSQVVRCWWEDPNAPSRPANTAFTPLENGSDGDGILTEGNYNGDLDPILNLSGLQEPPLDTPLGRGQGLHAIATVDEIAILLAPDEVRFDARSNLTRAVLTQCETLKDRFAVVSSRFGEVNNNNLMPPYDSKYGAFYFPWIKIYDDQNSCEKVIPPTGHIAGIYARTDIERGVHKAPANTLVRGARGLEAAVTKGKQDVLNPRHVNCMRDFRPDGRGIRLWGARTMSSDPEWKYVNVRRLFIFIEESIEEGTQWVVFEPNHEPTWAKVTRSITNFLVTIWKNGALEGLTEAEAFFVKCDQTTMTQDDIDNGRLICYIGIAPVKPAEFVIFRISQKTREATA